MGGDATHFPFLDARRRSWRTPAPDNGGVPAGLLVVRSPLRLPGPFRIGVRVAFSPSDDSLDATCDAYYSGSRSLIGVRVLKVAVTAGGVKVFVLREGASGLCALRSEPVLELKIRIDW